APSPKPTVNSGLGEYSFDSATLTLTHPEETRRLTAREAEVLTCLLKHCPQVVKREEILLSVWGDDDY
ncbi:MAG TPA: DNA-binding response regulator, partial [Cytophagales bacterium]|nr:DNA-binding response regulator [Cytophagales bacterium]